MPGRAMMPRGLANFVWVLCEPDRTRHMTAERMRNGRDVRLEPEAPVLVRTPPFYSPAAYLPQIAVAAVARLFGVPPFLGFYAGRFATLAASIIIIAIAGMIAPEFRDHFDAVAL